MHTYNIINGKIMIMSYYFASVCVIIDYFKMYFIIISRLR